MLHAVFGWEPFLFFCTAIGKLTENNPGLLVGVSTTLTTPNQDGVEHDWLPGARKGTPFQKKIAFWNARTWMLLPPSPGESRHGYLGERNLWQLGALQAFIGNRFCDGFYFFFYPVRNPYKGKTSIDGSHVLHFLSCSDPIDHDTHLGTYPWALPGLLLSSGGKNHCQSHNSQELILTSTE